MSGTECCGGLIVTVTHRSPSWNSCATCGQPVDIGGKIMDVPHCSHCDSPWIKMVGIYEPGEAYLIADDNGDMRRFRAAYIYRCQDCQAEWTTTLTGEPV